MEEWNIQINQPRIGLRRSKLLTDLPPHKPLPTEAAASPTTSPALKRPKMVQHTAPPSPNLSERTMVDRRPSLRCCLFGEQETKRQKVHHTEHNMNPLITPHTANTYCPPPPPTPNRTTDNEDLSNRLTIVMFVCAIYRW